MTRKVLTVLLAMALLLLWVTPVFANTTMYVYTDNGKPLNIRTDPWVGENIITTIPFGSEVSVNYFMEDGTWACIQWKQGVDAYVQSRYLISYRPTVITPTPVPMPTVAPTVVPYYPTYPTADPYSYYADSLITLNAEFRTARLVTPFTIIVRPARSSGWVNMRWAPSKDVELITTYRNGARLTVIAETQSWYQVVDPDTEATGFMMKAYTTRAN